MTEINKVAVIGSGVMGAAIAAHIANSGTPVLLLDIVPEGTDDRSSLAKSAVEKLLKTDPAPLTHKRNAKKITAGNLEDDLDKLADVDWIIEVIIERLDIKQSLYKKIDAVRKQGSVVSSNTSTLPLNHLVKDMPEAFQKDFMITHFFNPPRYMRLLELVGGNARPEAVEAIRQFCDVRLGKGVVDCKDTPGFIANRIGIFWLTAAVNHAIEQNISIETADAVMSRPVGIPKTGVFGLLDLIGIDLMPLIAKSFADTLDPSDTYLKIYTEHPLVTKMIADGYTGRKGKGGFYRLNTEGGKKVKESIHLQTGDYAPSNKPRLESVAAAKAGLNSLVTHPDEGGKYAWSVLRDTLLYAASLVPEISDDIASIDEAMRLGYNWKYGPFELIDKLTHEGTSGAAWFAQALEKEGREVPAILKAASNNPLYMPKNGVLNHSDLQGNYVPLPVSDDAYMLADVKRRSKPITKNPSACLWDLGDGIACLEFTTKMNSLDPLSMEMIQTSIEIVKKGYKGLVIANDSDNFCAGANIGLALFAANTASWKTLSTFIKQGQDTYMALKYAPFPVVSAPSGLALGGGCEILLHSDAVQAHIELYTGLVEVGVGLIPGWGGCKEMLYRHLMQRAYQDNLSAKMGNMFSFLSPIKTLNTMPPIVSAFRYISTAQVAKSAIQAKDMLILNEKSRISMNRKRLLPDAKKLCLELSHEYAAPEPFSVHLPGKTARTILGKGVDDFHKAGKATDYDVVVSNAVAYVLSGGETDITQTITEQQLLDLEIQQFDGLLRNENTLDRIEHMLATGKPLRN